MIGRTFRVLVGTAIAVLMPAALAGPPQPVLTAPSNYSIFLNNSPSVLLDWNQVAPVTSYQVYVSLNAGLGDPKAVNQSVSSSQTAFNLPTGLANGVYYWSVDAINSGQFSGVTGNIRTFILDRPFGAPIVTFPADSTQFVQGQTITFKWSPPADSAEHDPLVYPNGPIERYNFRLVPGTNLDDPSLIGPPSLGEEQNVTQKSVTLSFAPGTYRFAVRAIKKVPPVSGYTQAAHEAAIGWGPYGTVVFQIVQAPPTTGTVSVRSTPDAGAAIGVSQLDVQGLGNVVTNGSRTYTIGATVDFFAPLRKRRKITFST